MLHVAFERLGEEQEKASLGQRGRKTNPKTTAEDAISASLLSGSKGPRYTIKGLVRVCTYSTMALMCLITCFVGQVGLRGSIVGRRSSLKLNNGYKLGDYNFKDVST